jgi:hypothetical protein
MAIPRRSDRHRRAVGRASAVAASTVAATLILAGCGTGLRPSFDADEPAQTATGDPAVDAVLDRLDRVGIARFTADYTILTRLGGAQSTASVVQAEDSRSSVTVNDIRFIDGSTVATCNLTTDECEAIINDARVSDLQLTHDFYGDSFARRLRVDAARSLAPATGYADTIGGLPATCADVAVSGGTKVYCAIDAGVLARYDGADLRIDLVGFSDVPDETKFATS